MDAALPPGIAAMMAAQQQLDTEPPPQLEPHGALDSYVQPHVDPMSYVDHAAHNGTVPLVHQSSQGPLVIRGCFDGASALADTRACTSSTLYTTASDCPGVEEAFDSAAEYGRAALGHAAGITGTSSHRKYRKKVLPCLVCGKKFVNEHSLKIHMGIKHKEYKKGSLALKQGRPAPAQSTYSPRDSAPSLGYVIEPVQLQRATGRKSDVKVPIQNESGRFTCTWGCEQSFATRAGAWGHTAHCPLKATMDDGHYTMRDVIGTPPTHKGTKRKYPSAYYGATGEGSYVHDNASLHCDLCDYVAGGQFQLRQHRWIEHHSKHICMLCNAASPDGQSLAEHMRTEHGEPAGGDHAP